MYSLIHASRDGPTNIPRCVCSSQCSTLYRKYFHANNIGMGNQLMPHTHVNGGVSVCTLSTTFHKLIEWKSFPKRCMNSMLLYVQGEIKGHSNFRNNGIMSICGKQLLKHSCLQDTHSYITDTYSNANSKSSKTDQETCNTKCRRVALLND